MRDIYHAPLYQRPGRKMQEAIALIEKAFPKGQYRDHSLEQEMRDAWDAIAKGRTHDEIVKHEDYYVTKVTQLHRAGYTALQIYAVRRLAQREQG